MTPEPNNPHGMGYDANSTDASFARLFQRMDSQDMLLKEIRDDGRDVSRRVQKLESNERVHWGMSLSGLIAAAHHVITRLSGG